MKDTSTNEYDLIKKEEDNPQNQQLEFTNYYSIPLDQQQLEQCQLYQQQQYQSQKQIQQTDYMVLSRNINGGGCQQNNNGTYESMITRNVTQQQDTKKQQQFEPSLQSNGIAQGEGLKKGQKIAVMAGEIPLSSECIRQWKRVIGYEKKIDGNLYEFALQDMESQRLNFEEALLLVQQQTPLHFPALQVFIARFQPIHLKRTTRRIQAYQSYARPEVFNEFVAEFQKQFQRRTDKAIKTLLEPIPLHSFSSSAQSLAAAAAAAGYLVTLRSRWNIQNSTHELYKVGFSRKFISLLGTDPDSLCYDYMKNGVRNFLDDESLLNLSSVLICYHMTKCLQERRSILVNIKSYDGLAIQASCTIQFHAEKMDAQNSYFESIVTLNFEPDQQQYHIITSFRNSQQMQQQQQLQQQQNAFIPYSPQQRYNQQHPMQLIKEPFITNQEEKQDQLQKLQDDQQQPPKPLPVSTIDNKSLENNKLILQKFYGFSFESGNRSSKTAKRS